MPSLQGMSLGGRLEPELLCSQVMFCSFLSNKGAMAGTFIAVGLAGVLGIWLVASFMIRRRRRAAREARHLEYENDMVAYEKKHGLDVELAPAPSQAHHGGHNAADDSFGDEPSRAHADLDDVAVLAPANAYPDRSLHYGYGQQNAAYEQGAYDQTQYAQHQHAAYDQNAYQQHGQAAAYGQDYPQNQYIDYPPAQAEHDPNYSVHQYHYPETGYGYQGAMNQAQQPHPASGNAGYAQ
jgi:hypothetical protein